MNNFNFFGVTIDGGGKPIATGNIITFTGGILTNAGWGASKANTLEEITNSKVLWAIKHYKSMVLMLSKLEGEELFKFKEQTEIPRFTLEIRQSTKKLKEIQFQKIKITNITPREFKDIKILSATQPHHLHSFNEVYIEVPNPSQIIVV